MYLSHCVLKITRNVFLFSFSARTSPVTHAARYESASAWRNEEARRGDLAAELMAGLQDRETTASGFRTAVSPSLTASFHRLLRLLRYPPSRWIFHCSGRCENCWCTSSTKLFPFWQAPLRLVPIQYLASSRNRTGAVAMARCRFGVYNWGGQRRRGQMWACSVLTLSTTKDQLEYI